MGASAVLDARADALAAALLRASEPPCAPCAVLPRCRKRLHDTDGPVAAFAPRGHVAHERRRKRRALTHLAAHLGVLGEDGEDTEPSLASPLPQHGAGGGDSGGSLLHREVLAFAAAVALTVAEQRMRKRALAAIRAAVASLWPDAQVVLFGSTATGLSLPSSDLDVVVFGVPGLEELQSQSGTFTVGERTRAVSLLNRLKRALQASGTVGGARVIAARVPIIKCVTSIGELPCDLSLGVANGAAAVPLVLSLIDQYPALRPLMLVLKSFLAQRGLHSPWTGGIGSYALLNLVCAYLAQSGPPPADLGDALAGFFRFYATFDYRRCGVSIMRGGVVPKAPPRTFALHVADPQETSKDIGAAAFNLRAARAAFTAAATRLAGHRQAVQTAAPLLPPRPADLWALVQADGQSRSAGGGGQRAAGGVPSVLGRIVCISKALRRRPPKATVCASPAGKQPPAATPGKQRTPSKQPEAQRGRDRPAF
jgi:hypothetical protein